MTVGLIGQTLFLSCTVTAFKLCIFKISFVNSMEYRHRDGFNSYHEIHSCNYAIVNSHVTLS